MHTGTLGTVPDTGMLVLLELGRVGTKDFEDGCSHVTCSHSGLTRGLRDRAWNIEFFEFVHAALKLCDCDLLDGSELSQLYRWWRGCGLSSSHDADIVSDGCRIANARHSRS